MTVEVSAVAFAYISPYTLRVLAVAKGYPIHLYTGKEPLQLNGDQNIVMVPNLEKRFELGKYAEHIYRLVLLSKEHWKEIVELGVPILDASISGDRIEMSASGRKVQHYFNEIDRRAVSISLIPPEKQTVAKPAESLKKAPSLKTLNEKLDFLMQQLQVDDFDRIVEQPICTYLIGQMNQGDLEKALKALVSKGGTPEFLRPFYQWLTGSSGQALSKAAKEFLWPPDQQTKELETVAENFKIDADDLDFVAAVYQEMQTPIETEKEGEAYDDDI